MFRPIRMDHTNCLQVAIKTLHSFSAEETRAAKACAEEHERDVHTLFNRLETRTSQHSCTPHAPRARVCLLSRFTRARSLSRSLARSLSALSLLSRARALSPIQHMQHARTHPWARARAHTCTLTHILSLSLSHTIKPTLKREAKTKPPLKRKLSRLAVTALAKPMLQTHKALSYWCMRP